MIKGLLALFRSGVIFDPFVLMGIILGIFTALSSNKEAVEHMYNSDSFYLLIMLLAVLYNFFIKKVYKDDGFKIDYPRMIWQIVLSVVKFVLACAFTIVFILMIFSF